MNGFKLYSLVIDNKTVNTEKIQLVENFKPTGENYFSLIVGNNGTGKSRILSEIARFFNHLDRDSYRHHLFMESDFEFNKIPTKIIAITNSISDKFPADKSYRPYSNPNTEIKYKDFKYNYLGTRNSINSFSNRALMNRALEIVFENYFELEVSKNYRHIFDYLDYEPVIKLNYKFKSRFLKEFPNINPELLVEYVENRFFGQFSYKSEKLLNYIRFRASEICDFIIDKIQYSNSYEGELTINFSEKNIGRIRIDNSLYSNNVYQYEIISLLKKIDIVTAFEIQVFKKGGVPFNFREASSGEANILSTLLSVIPLLKDDSLILIDEPEISLHPEWQAKYIDLLNKILESVKGCHVIIASHSPFLASDLKPSNSSVISLRNKKGVIYSKTVDNSTYGWAAEDILLNVFEMQSTRNFNLYENISRALVLLSKNERSDIEFKKIQKNLMEFYSSVLETDPIKPIIKAIFEVSE